MNKIAKLVAAAATAGLATAALAIVTFTPSTGTGFAGKGDVQLAFGWNNSQLQKNAKGVSFSFVQEATYTAVCTFVTGEGKKGERVHNVPHKTTVGLIGEVAYDARVANQITGFNLKGFAPGSITEVGAVPVIGQPCPGNDGHDGLWTDAVQTSYDATLNAVFGGVAVKVWPQQL